MKVEIYNVAEITPNTAEQELVFALFTKEQGGVYGILCPNKETILPDKILDYPLPDRVKDTVKLIEVSPRFYQYEVWHADQFEIKDPILLGREKDPAQPTYNWYDKFYLIARWGEELQPFSELKVKAISFLKEHSIGKALKLKAMTNAFLDNPDLFCKIAIERGTSNLCVPDFNL